MGLAHPYAVGDEARLHGAVRVGGAGAGSPVTASPARDDVPSAPLS